MTGTFPHAFVARSAFRIDRNASESRIVDGTVVGVQRMFVHFAHAYATNIFVTHYSETYTFNLTCHFYTNKSTVIDERNVQILRFRRRVRSKIMISSSFICYNCKSEFDRESLVRQIFSMTTLSSTPHCGNCGKKFNRPTILNKIFLNDSQLISRYDAQRCNELSNRDDLYDREHVANVVDEIFHSTPLNSFASYVLKVVTQRIVDEIETTNRARREFIDVYFKDYPHKIARYTSISKFDCDLLVDRLESIRDFFIKDNCEIDKFGQRHNYVASPTFYRLSVYKNKNDMYEDCLVSTA